MYDTSVKSMYGWANANANAQEIAEDNSDGNAFNRELQEDDIELTYEQQLLAAEVRVVLEGFLVLSNLGEDEDETTRRNLRASSN